MRTKKVFVIAMAVITIISSLFSGQKHLENRSYRVKNAALQSEIAELNSTVAGLKLQKNAAEIERDYWIKKADVYNAWYKECAAEVAELLNLIALHKDEPKELSYTEEELYLLASVMYAENGCDWFPPVIQLMTGSVVLNRVQNDMYPDTIYDVVYQSGQYGCAWNGSFSTPPSNQAIENARYLLENGSILPENVIYQSGVPQGSGIYFYFHDPILDSHQYFCCQ